MTATARFAYDALRSDGTVERGTVDATSHSDAVAALGRRGMLVLEVRAADQRRTRGSAPSTADLGLGLRILADLLDAGVPVARALNTLGELTPPSWRALLLHLKESVRDGKSLGGALRDAPVDVPPLVVGMTLAGEAAGDVGAAVRRAADVTESVAETRAAVRGALAYPLVLACAGTGAIALMVGVVIPRFAVILGDLGQSMPPLTRLVMSGATAIRAAFFPLLGVVALIAILVRAAIASESGRQRWHALLLQAPALGVVRHSLGTARACFTLATLLETGVPLRQAMRLAARASGDSELTARMQGAAERIETGQRIAAALRDTRAMTALALRLVQAGEESSRLADMLRHAARIEQRRTDRVTQTAVRLLEPVLILVFAGIVALVAAALLQAVYSVRPTS